MILETNRGKVAFHDPSYSLEAETLDDWYPGKHPVARGSALVDRAIELLLCFQRELFGTGESILFPERVNDIRGRQLGRSHTTVEKHGKNVRNGLRMVEVRQVSSLQKRGDRSNCSDFYRAIRCRD